MILIKILLTSTAGISAMIYCHSSEPYDGFDSSNYKEVSTQNSRFKLRLRSNSDRNFSHIKLSWEIKKKWNFHIYFYGGPIKKIRNRSQTTKVSRKIT